ncbi:protease HtpX [Synechococcus sp. 1G10]|uniref:protease HtpX n=1 Tax=Synechococcus sp. 1G10 TaxID=2025605 RepID=UPI000B990D73|nr:protease HtpX [Synechococcus sp. 1G10]
MVLRTVLFLITNLAVVATISLLLWLGVATGWLPPDLPLIPLLIGSFGWGVVGSWISLQVSRQSAIQAMGVQLVDGREGASALWLVETVARLANKAELPMPEVGVYASPEWNAFATGASPEGALVAVSSGILEGMPQAELEAVLAHEMSHVGNGDMVTMALLQGVINAFVMFLARAIALLLPRRSDDQGRQPPPISALIWPLELLLGIAGSLVTAWFSRHREFRADAGAARLTAAGAMVGALQLLGQTQDLLEPRDGTALASFKIAGLPSLLGLFASHPPLEQRIAALQELQSANPSTP